MCDRRTFLALLSSFITAACGAQSEEDDDIQPIAAAQGRHVVVIGAGMAGAKAARDLSSAGFRVTLLEARNRIGGRIWTDRSWNTALDLGAGWIHGISGNPIHRLATSLDLPLFKWDYENLEYFGGSQGDRDRFFGAIWRMEGELYRAAERLYAENPYASVRDVIDIMTEKGAFDKLSAGDKALLLQVFIEQDASANVDQLALAGLLSDEEFGGSDVLFPGGYDQLVTALLDGLDVKLGARVTRIETMTDTVRVTTVQDSLTADFVVLTASLGVLQSGAIDFVPALPAEKSAAIEKLQMGVLNKVYLRFPEIFWNRNVNVLVRSSDERAHWPVWLNLATMKDEPILCAFNGGRFGEALETLTDTDIVDQAVAVLRDMYGTAIPTPTDQLITRWRNDPLAFGSYTYVPPGVLPETRDDLAAPIADRLFFAGEASSADYPATVHGAYLTGRRAGREVVAALS